MEKNHPILSLNPPRAFSGRFPVVFRSAAALPALVSVLLCLCCITPAAAADKNGTKVHSMQDVLERFSDTQRTVRTLKAAFRQVHISRLLADPLISEGEVIYAHPDKLLITINRPQPLSVLIKNDRMLVINPSAATVQQRTIPRGQNPLEWMRQRERPLAALEDRFHIQMLETASERGYHFKLSPQEKDESHFKALYFVIQPDLWLPDFIRLETLEGDAITMEFRHFSLNPSLPEDTFSVLPMEKGGRR